MILLVMDVPALVLNLLLLTLNLQRRPIRKRWVADEMMHIIERRLVPHRWMRRGRLCNLYL
jgi:hypothetical protein